MTSIAILGSGRVGTALAVALSAAGHHVVVGSRNPEHARGSWQGPDLPIVSVEEAITSAEVVFNATPGDTAVSRLSAVREHLSGKILVDVANATHRGDGGPGGLIYPESSLAEELQRVLPDTAVVKTLNTMLFMVMGNPALLNTPATVFLSGESSDAKGTVAALLTDLGWTTDQILDLGGIASARGTEALILLVPSVLQARGFAPFAIGVVS